MKKRPIYISRSELAEFGFFDDIKERAEKDKAKVKRGMRKIKSYVKNKATEDTEKLVKVRDNVLKPSSKNWNDSRFKDFNVHDVPVHKQVRKASINIANNVGKEIGKGVAEVGGYTGDVIGATSKGIAQGVADKVGNNRTVRKGTYKLLGASAALGAGVVIGGRLFGNNNQNQMYFDSKGNNSYFNPYDNRPRSILDIGKDRAVGGRSQIFQGLQDAKNGTMIMGAGLVWKGAKGAARLAKKVVVGGAKGIVGAAKAIRRIRFSSIPNKNLAIFEGEPKTGLAALWDDVKESGRKGLRIGASSGLAKTASTLVNDITQDVLNAVNPRKWTIRNIKRTLSDWNPYDKNVPGIKGLLLEKKGIGDRIAYGRKYGLRSGIKAGLLGAGAIGTGVGGGILARNLVNQNNKEPNGVKNV